MDLVEIDVVGTEATQAIVDGAQYVLARKSLSVGAVSHGEVDLGRNYDLVAYGKIA